MGNDGRDTAALRHPIFWAALALLVVNDHVLKGAGVLPSWLTGKLSDFAGLIVAPILASAILGARGARRRGLAFAAIAGWFAAVKLVPAAARASTALAASLGLDWSIRVDSTDLVALAVLPLAWHVASHRSLAPRAWMERLALGLGVAACIASPPPNPSWFTAAFLVNRTTEPVEVRVRWLDARVDCSAIRDRFAEALSRDAFSAGTLFTLEPDHTLPLDRGLLDSTGMGTGAPVETGHVGTCDVALLSIDGMPDTMVFWDGLSAQTVLEVDSRATAEGGLAIEQSSEGTRTLDASAGYRLAGPIDVWDEGACHDYGRITGFDWSDLPPWPGGTVTLTEVREGIDGCMSLTIDADGMERRAYVCVPATDFPFASGNVVRVWNGEGELRIVRELTRDDGSTWRVGELVVHRGAGRFREGPFDVSVVEVDEACEGVRMDCGGFRVPGAGGIELVDGTRFVNPGEAMERDAADGRRARLRVGRAETMWVTRDACGAGRDELGPRLEALVVYGEETR